MKRVLFPISLLSALAIVAAPATVRAQYAQGSTAPGEWTVPGTALIATGPDVWVRFFGADARYTSQLFFCTALDQCSDDVLFQNNTPVDFTPGQEVRLSGNFIAGQEVYFRLFVMDTQDSWYTGAEGNNADGVAHFATQSVNDVTDNATYTVLGGFEDKNGGGDRDYNDLMFEFGGVQQAVTATPEPATIAMLAPALVGLGGVVQRRRKNKKDATDA